MRIHTALDESAIRGAARLAGATLVRLDTHGSRKAARAFDVILSGSAKHACHWSRSGEYRAATWDEWGIFLDALYRRDPAMDCRAYVNAEHFAWSTANRYDDGIVNGRPCQLHKWEWHGDRHDGYNVHTCKHCNAVRRYIMPGFTWDQVADNDGDAYRDGAEHYSGPYSQGRDYAGEYLAEATA